MNQTWYCQQYETNAEYLSVRNDVLNKNTERCKFYAPEKKQRLTAQMEIEGSWGIR